MHLRIGRIFVLVAAILAASMVPSRAAIVPVSQSDGVNFSYTAVDTNGTLVITFDPSSLITRINGAVISPTLPAAFATLTLSPTQLTDDIPGLSGHFAPSLNSTKYGISSLSPAGAPNVVFDYNISFGQASANGLTMTGVVALDPASATTFTQGANTYDFSLFQNFAQFTISLGTQDANPTLLHDVLKSGNGTFSGTGQFNQYTSPTIPEPASLTLLSIGVLTLAARRRKV